MKLINIIRHAITQPYRVPQTWSTLTSICTKTFIQTNKTWKNGKREKLKFSITSSEYFIVKPCLNIVMFFFNFIEN